MPTGVFGWIGFAASVAFGIIITILSVDQVIADHRHRRRMRALRKHGVSPLDWAARYDTILNEKPHAARAAAKETK